MKIISVTYTRIDRMPLSVSLLECADFGSLIAESSHHLASRLVEIFAHSNQSAGVKGRCEA